MVRMRTLLLAAMMLPGRGQTPAFDVTSVRPRTNAEHGPMIYNCTPGGRFTNAGPMRQVILWAYGIKPYQLVGMPEWDPVVMYDNSGLYTIDARAAGPVTEEVCKLMVQKLLAERFKLATHWEARETPVYELVVAKDGPKLRKPGDPGVKGNHILIAGKAMVIAPEAPGWSMQRLADFVSQADRGRPVLDKTGLEGLYWIDLDFTPDGMNDPPPGAGPELPAAIQQMGLRLNPAKAPVRMLIIDHMEMPDAN